MTNIYFSYIDTLIIREGFVQPEDIEEAYKIVNMEKENTKLPLCAILVKDFSLPEKELVKILNNLSLYEKTVEIIKARDHIQSPDLDILISQNSNPAKLLTLLEEKAIITKEDKNSVFNEILDLTESGKLAFKLGITDEISLERSVRKKRFNTCVCEILYEKHLITLSELNHIFRQLDNSLRVGEILMTLGLIDRKVLEETLTEQKKESGLTLGNILINNKNISVNQLYFALSIQYNTPFRPLTNFMYAENQLRELKNMINREFAQENLIIPLLLTGNNLTLGVFNPYHMANINDIMSKYSYLQINCVLITHNKFEQLYAILYGEVFNVNNDLIKRNRKETDPRQKTVISEPDSQYRLINDLFDKYKNLGTDLKISNFNPQQKIFHSFINENYTKICARYNCSHVSFWFDVTKDNIEIMASPVLSK